LNTLRRVRFISQPSQSRHPSIVNRAVREPGSIHSQRDTQ
jgi:hypothetical protein